MQANRRRHWPAQRIPLERAVMALATHPQWRTIQELAREIGVRGILTRAVLEPIRLGLLESHGSSVRPPRRLPTLNDWSCRDGRGRSLP